MKGLRGGAGRSRIVAMSRGHAERMVTYATTGAPTGITCRWDGDALAGAFMAPRTAVVERGRSFGKRAAIAAWCVALWLCGCARPLPLSVHDDRAAPAPLVASGLPASVDDACAAWGLECEADRGAPVVVLLLPEGSGLEISGRTLLTGGCARAAVAVDDPGTMAHELGHLLGLPDVDSPGNVMHWRRGPGLELEADQLDEAERQASALVGCP